MIAIDKLRDVAALLEAHLIEDPVKEAEGLITEALLIDKARLYTSDIEIPDELSKRIDSFVERRSKGEPLQYIIGHVEFCGLKINVGKGVLIPRPETELLAEETIKAVMSYELEVMSRNKSGSGESGRTETLPITHHPVPITILDLCTGSGCIALALAKHYPDAVVVGTDRSRAAVEYSVRNAEENNILNVSFIKGDLFDAVKGIEFDLIVSNPPYVRREEIKTLQREVKDYEPLEALDGGPDGLDFYRRIFKEAPGYLKRDGLLILEMGYDQAGDINKLDINSGVGDISFIKDYAGIKRIFISKKG